MVRKVRRGRCRVEREKRSGEEEKRKSTLDGGEGRVEHHTKPQKKKPTKKKSHKIKGEGKVKQNAPVSRTGQKAKGENGPVL